MAKEVKDTDGLSFHGWMRTRLGLTGGELFTYALVHQFSQSNAGRYLGGPGYLAAWLGCSENTARKYLHTLVEKGLLINRDREENGVTFRDYLVNNDPLQKFEYPSKNLSTPLQKFEVEDNIDNTPNGVSISIKSPTPLKFDFRRALLEAGVEPEIADAWMQVRKAKKAVNTEIAWKAIEREIAKTANTANECIRYAVEHSWCGFKAEWCENATARSTRPATGTERNARRGGDYMNTMAGVAAELGLIGGSYDEQ